jgi:hypothetical protein
LVIVTHHLSPGLSPENRNGGDEVVADALLMVEELRAHNRADRVAAEVSRPGATASVAVEAGQWIGAAALQRAA